MKKEITLQEFQDRLQDILARNGWAITLECSSSWDIRVFDKETGNQLASTGATGLYGILDALEKSFNVCPWV